MSTTLTNASYINIFDEKLRSYNNIFFKTLQDYDLLNETTDIKTGSKALNIGGVNTYRTDQFNEFIRNIINFDIKNYSDLSATGTNLEFVNRSVNGSTATYSFNDDVRDNIIDTLKILNVFVDILEAYKHCIDKDIPTITTGYFDEIDIEKIEIVSSGTRFYVSGAASAVPDINTYKNVGYIRNTKTSASATPKNVLYLSIQSFYTGLTTANYNTIFDKKVIDGNYSVSDNCDKITMQIFDPSDTAATPLSGLVLAKKDYAMHFYDKTITINKSGLTREQRNKNVVSLLLKCLFNIDPKYRKQSVYGLYYYYKFVQLYATLIINVSNVMYADVNDTANYPKRIDIYNTGNEISVTAIEVVTEGIGYHNNIDTSLANPVAVTATGGGGTSFAGTIPYNSTTGRIAIGTSVSITNNGTGFTAPPTIETATPKYKADQIVANKTGSIAKQTADAQTAKKTAEDALVLANTNLAGYPAPGASVVSGASAYTGLSAENKLLAETSINSANFLSDGSVISDTAAIKSAAQTAVYPNLASGATASAISTNTSNRSNALIYIDLLVAKKIAELNLNIKQNILNNLINSLTTLSSEPADTAATFKATIVPLAYHNTTKTQIENIDRFKDVFNDIETKIVALTTSIRNADDPASEASFVILTSGTTAKIMASDKDNVLIMIAASNTEIYKKLINYSNLNDLVNDCSIYDKQNKKYYDILNITTFTSNNVEYFGIEINAVFVKDLKKEYVGLFYKYNGDTYTEIKKTSENLSANGEFLEIKRKDINSLKNKYVNNKKAIDELNANISLNTNRVNNQKNLYETQYNKNVFLSRQILTYNILICTIIVVLIGINVFKIDKPLVKSISLACLGIIILLFIIYFMSNITYIETFAVDSTNITTLKNTSGDITARNTNKVSALKTEIDKLNAQFIRYFETIMIKLPTSDSHDFYKEITSVINADIENKTYLDKILDFNKSQGNTNMDTLKYELENNKLYILTLLISSIIFIGLYNIYINYIDNEKYLSLMIFIAIIIFIVIGSYYIINSNRRVRTIHKNIYWGPQSSESF
jgi:hypothetical protein